MPKIQSGNSLGALRPGSALPQSEPAPQKVRFWSIVSAMAQKVSTRKTLQTTVVGLFFCSTNRSVLGSLWSHKLTIAALHKSSLRLKAGRQMLRKGEAIAMRQVIPQTGRQSNLHCAWEKTMQSTSKVKKFSTNIQNLAKPETKPTTAFPCRPPRAGRVLLTELSKEVVHLFGFSFPNEKPA